MISCAEADPSSDESRADQRGESSHLPRMRQVQSVDIERGKANLDNHKEETKVIQ